MLQSVFGSDGQIHLESQVSSQRFDRWEHEYRHRQGWRGDGDSGGADAPNTGQAWLRLAV